MSSAKDDYQEDDIVFAMVTGYPWWPGFIAEKYSKKNYKVTFFGDFSYSDLNVKHIKPFVRGLKKADPNNKDLNEAIQSAKRVVEGQSTIIDEHKKVQEKLGKKRKNQKSQKTKTISKKKKSLRKSKRTRKSVSGGLDRSIKTRAKRRLKSKIREDACQSMIQDTTHKRKADRATQKKREAKLGKSMDQKLLMCSEEDDISDTGKILDELSDKKSIKKKDGSIAKSKRKSEHKSKSKENKKKKNIKKLETEKENIKEEKSIEKDVTKKKENENKKGNTDQSPLKEDIKQMDKTEEHNSIQIEQDQQDKQDVPDAEDVQDTQKDKKTANKIEGDKEEKEEFVNRPISPIKSEIIEKSVQKDPSVNQMQEEESFNDRFVNFENKLQTLLNEMKDNKPIPSIEENLKEWFNQISRINHFSPIVSTDIGKHLSKMSQICLERINEKQIYNKILNNIEHLKNFIIERISKNFFNTEQMEELDSRIHNEDSIITTKKNDSSSKIARVGYTDSSIFPSTMRTPVDPQVRLRIQKKLAKTISKMVGRNTIKKETCIMLGKRIEEFLHVESRDSDELYRENVVKLLEFMKKSKKKFIDEFIFQKSNKCDIQLLRIKIIQLLGHIN